VDADDDLLEKEREQCVTFTAADLKAMAWALHRMAYWQPVVALSPATRRRLAWANIKVVRGASHGRKVWTVDQEASPGGLIIALLDLYPRRGEKENRVRYHRRIGHWKKR
jgi:hypothetical protein